jgi:hypothetical protein
MAAAINPTEASFLICASPYVSMIERLTILCGSFLPKRLQATFCGIDYAHHQG